MVLERIRRLISPERGLVVPNPEQIVEVSRFTEEAKHILEEDGATIYELEGTTLNSQREAQKAKGKPSFSYVTDGGDRLLLKPSRLSEVAIFADPERFFVPNSGGKYLPEQERLVKADADDLRKRLKSEDVDEVIPREASTLTEVIFKHLDETGVWLFGSDYNVLPGFIHLLHAPERDGVYGRTSNPLDKFGIKVANVGHANPDRGIVVDYYGTKMDGNDYVGAIRLIVPRVIR